MRRPILAAALVVGGCAPLVFAQTNTPANGQQPVNVKRQPPAVKKNPPVPQVLQNYDFGAQLQALQNVDTVEPGTSAAKHSAM